MPDQKQRQPEDSRSKWSEDGARLTATQDSTSEWREVRAQVKIDMDEAACDLTSLSLNLFLFESIDQLDGGEEARTLLVMFDGLHAKCRGDMCFAGARRSRDIVPGIRRLTDEFTIGSILGMARAFQ